MRRALSPFAIAVSVAGALYMAAASLPVFAGELEVSADTPTIVVSTRPAGRNFMRLPNLDYLFAIDATCPAELRPSSISISIADTRISIEEAEISAAMPLYIPVTVPASQIGPIAVDRYCTVDQVEGSDPSGPDLTIPAVLSAQVSLLCAGESGSEMTYAANSLDVTLRCSPEPEEEIPTPVE